MPIDYSAADKLTAQLLEETVVRMADALQAMQQIPQCCNEPSAIAMRDALFKAYGALGALEGITKEAIKALRR